MERDPIVEEVRRVRREIETACDNDPDKYYEYLVAVQKQFQTRVVRLPSKAAPDVACVAEERPGYGGKRYTNVKG